MNSNVEPKEQSGMIRYVWLTIGGISFALGTAGIVLPLLPTVPFYMLTLFCLARGSKRFHEKFINSQLYQKTVGEYEKDKALTVRAKCTILLSVSCIMGIGAYFAWHMPIAIGVMAFVWICHVIALCFIVETKKAE